jgi:hypothetical protein
MLQRPGGRKGGSRLAATEVKEGKRKVSRRREAPRWPVGEEGDSAMRLWQGVELENRATLPPLQLRFAADFLGLLDVWINKHVN